MAESSNGRDKQSACMISHGRRFMPRFQDETKQVNQADWRDNQTTLLSNFFFSPLRHCAGASESSYLAATPTELFLYSLPTPQEAQLQYLAVPTLLISLFLYLF